MWHQIVDFANAHTGLLLGTLPATGAGIALALARLFTRRYDPSDPYSRKPKCWHKWSDEWDATPRFYSGRTCLKCGRIDVREAGQNFGDISSVLSRNRKKEVFTNEQRRRLKELCDGPKLTETSNDRVYLTRRSMWWCDFGAIPIFQRANGDAVVVCRFDNGKIGDPVGEDITAER